MRGPSTHGHWSSLSQSWKTAQIPRPGPALSGCRSVVGRMQMAALAPAHGVMDDLHTLASTPGWAVAFWRVAAGDSRHLVEDPDATPTDARRTRHRLSPSCSLIPPGGLLRPDAARRRAWRRVRRTRECLAPLAGAGMAGEHTSSRVICSRLRLGVGLPTIGCQDPASPTLLERVLRRWRVTHGLTCL